MKRFFLIFSFFLFILDVDALSNTGKLYEEFWQESGVNVFASSSVGTMDYNGWQVKSTNDDKIYYCIEPEIYMPNATDASIGTHKIYEGKNTVIDNSRLNDDTYKRVNLLAYYGYMYGNHLDKKWYGITQTMIWRTLRKDITWSFKESRYGIVNNSLHQKEVSELEELVNNHYVKPSFDNKKIEVLLNEEIVITDTNNVLKYFFIESNSSNFSIYQEENKLIIKGLNEGLGSVNMAKKSNMGYDFLLFSGGSFQDVISRGEVDDVYSNFTIDVIKGQVTLSKIDAETKKSYPQGDALLKGAIYQIYDENDNVVEKIVFDENLTTTIDLPFGKYYIKEIKAPDGYNLNEKIYEFELNSDNKKIQILLEDYVIKANYRIHKVKGGSGEELVFEDGAQFLITNKDNSFKKIITTDKDGIAEIDLVYGTYLITQVRGEEGYEFIKPYNITIDKNNNIDVYLQNLKKSKLIITKIDKDTKEKLSNAKIAIYDEDNNLYEEKITNEDGIIEIKDIPIGKYYVKEISSPTGYILNEKHQAIDVLNNGEVIEITLENTKFHMPDTSSNKIDKIKNIFPLLLLVFGFGMFMLSYVKDNN